MFITCLSERSDQARKTPWSYSHLTAFRDTDDLANTHTSARSRSVEVIRSERRRRWPAEQKQAIVAETRVPGVSVAGIARKHSIGTGLLYSWRRRFLGELPAMTPGITQVELSDASTPLLAGPIMPGAGSSGLIEIALPNGASVRVDAKMDERAFRRVLRVLRER
jgi:transposase